MTWFKSLYFHWIEMNILKEGNIHTNKLFPIFPQQITILLFCVLLCRIEMHLNALAFNLSP